jgi:hypothetical protein
LHASVVVAVFALDVGGQERQLLGKQARDVAQFGELRGARTN